MVKVISDASEIPKDKKVVIDFYADWCGPCKRVAPVFVELSEKYPDIVFLKVNVDESEQISSAFEITALPTFVFLNKGNIQKQIEGANLDEIFDAIENLKIVS